MTESLLLFFIGLLIFASAFFSGSESALFSLSPMRIKSYETDGDSRHQLIFKLLSQPRNLLVTVFIMNTIVNILIQNIFSTLFGIETSWIWKVGVPLVITLIIGEIIPKNICLQYNTAVSYSVAPAINFFHNLLGPIRKATVAITIPISRVLFFYLKKEESISHEELHHVLATSEKHGVLHPDESTWVKGFLNMSGSIVKEAMWPKEDVIFYKESEPLSKLEYLFVDQECTRIPVCKTDLDSVQGIISAKQYFLYKKEIHTTEDLEKYLSKPFFIPEAAPLQTALKQLNEKKEEIALAVDEYGTITGLIAYEDITELVIGEVSDRRDQKTFYTKAGKNEIIASGKLELAEFNRLFDADLISETGMITIGGWLTEKMGDIPKEGQKFLWQNFLFQVLAAEPTRIRRLYIHKLSPTGGIR